MQPLPPRSFTAAVLITLIGLTKLLAKPAEDAGDALQARLDLADQYDHLPELIHDTLSSPQWLAEGERFVYWSAVGPQRGTWVLVDAPHQTLTPLIPPDALQAQLVQMLGKSARLAQNPAFAITPDQKGIVFRVGKQALFLSWTARKLMALGSTGQATLALTDKALCSRDLHAAAQQRGTGFAVVDSSGRTLLEKSGEENYEWQVPSGTWSPDGRFLMVFRNDARSVHKIPIVDYTTAQERVSLVPYTKVGTPLVRTELYVVEPATGRVTSVPTAAAESYDWFAGWRPNSHEALLLQLSRNGKRLDLVAVDPLTAKTRLVLHEERPESFVGALDFWDTGWALQVTMLKDNQHFLWMSERDNWRHVYLYDYAGKLVRQITKGAFPVHQVIGESPAGDTLFLSASADPSAPYDRLFYQVPLRGGSLQRLSPAPGMHRINLSPSGKYYTDGHSTRTAPRIWDVASTDGKTSLRYARSDISALAALHYTPPEPLTVQASDNKTRLYGVLYRPWDFDPKKHYPVIDMIYAGPFIAVVPWSFVGNRTSLTASSLAQMGFIVMVLDARGTPGRGKAFQDANYGRVGQIEIPDHVAALRQAAASRPYMDMQRVGIYGHSWGGYFALRGMLTAPELFSAGYAGAPGALEEEAIINEPNLGLITNNPAGYAAGSNLTVAGNLRGTLRIMHGTSDVNASLSTTMRMSEALIRAGKRFELLIMPGQPHSPRQAAGRYYNDDVRLFFVRVLGGPRAASGSGAAKSAN